jgi:hypothetical protein
VPNTAQLTDHLDDIIDSTWDDVRDLLKDYFITHGGDLPCLSNDLDDGGEVASLIDSAVPIYSGELAELEYFHHDAAFSALVDTFGSADGNWPTGAFAAGLYCLIEQGVSRRWDEDAEYLWQEWLDELDTATVRKFALAQWTAQQSTEPPTTPEA